MWIPLGNLAGAAGDGFDSFSSYAALRDARMRQWSRRYLVKLALYPSMTLLLQVATMVNSRQLLYTVS